MSVLPVAVRKTPTPRTAPSIGKPQSRRFPMRDGPKNRQPPTTPENRPMAPDLQRPLEHPMRETVARPQRRSTFIEFQTPPEPPMLHPAQRALEPPMPHSVERRLQPATALKLGKPSEPMSQQTPQNRRNTTTHAGCCPVGLLIPSAARKPRPRQRRRLKIGRRLQSPRCLHSLRSLHFVRGFEPV
jgi:hypothetical protein